MAINMMCMNSTCKYYWEDSCTRNLKDERIVIDADGLCESFKEGKSDWYMEEEEWMERLTRISEITDFYMPIKMQESCGESACKEICEQYEGDGCKECPIQECITRLAEYEELEMSPEEIKELNDFEKSQISVLLKEKEKINEERKYWRNETLKLASKLREQKIERSS